MLLCTALLPTACTVQPTMHFPSQSKAVTFVACEGRRPTKNMTFLLYKHLRSQTFQRQTSLCRQLCAAHLDKAELDGVRQNRLNF